MGDKSLWLRTEMAAQVGTLRWMADRGAPAAAATVDTKVLTVLGTTRDGARFLYSKTFAPVRPDPEGTVTGVPDLVDLYFVRRRRRVTRRAPLPPAPTALNAAALRLGGARRLGAAPDTLATAQDGGGDVALTSCDEDVFATLPAQAAPGRRARVRLPR